MKNIQTFENRLNALLAKQGYLQSEFNKELRHKKELRKRVEGLQEVHEVMKQSAALVQQHVAEQLSSIVTEGVRAVINKPYEFVVEFVDRRGTSECDLYIKTEDGFRRDILDGLGGGIADVCSFTLRLSYILLSGAAKIIVIDEAARHINSPEQREMFAQVVRNLVDEFNLQLVLITGVKELIDIADSIYEFKDIDGVSNVRRL